MQNALAMPIHDLTLARARAGETGALGELYEALAPALYTLLKRICRSPEDAEDLLQDSFIAIARDLRNFRGEGSLVGWAKRIAATQALMHYRRAGRFAAEELELVDYEPHRQSAPDQAIAAKLDVSALLYRLPPAARLVLWLHEAEGYTHEEIGALAGFTPSYSKSQLARAHQKLRALRGPEARHES